MEPNAALSQSTTSFRPETALVTIVPRERDDRFLELSQQVRPNKSSLRECVRTTVTDRRPRFLVSNIVL